MKESLCQIGFTENEATVYMELLKLGPQAVSTIANKVGLNRTTTYSVLKSLEKRGVVSHYNNSSIKYFVADDPNSIVGYLDRKCRTYDYYRGQLLSAIPKFRSLDKNIAFKRPIVTYYDGVEGVKHVMHDALDAKGEVFAYIAFPKWFKLGLKDFLLEYRDIRIFTKKVPLSVIAPDTKEVRAFFDENYAKNNDMTKILYVSNEDHGKCFENEMLIYDDKVVIIGLNKGDEYGVVVQNKQIATMNRMIFGVAWQGFKKKKI
ncbi:MAG: helix-turn-helix domain-containing protein [Candidatus Peregrinibacteria bacterium]